VRELFCGFGVTKEERSDRRATLQTIRSAARIWPLRAHNSQSGFYCPVGGFEDGLTGRFVMQRGRLWGEAASFIASQAARGFGGWGGRSACPNVTAAPIKRKSALGDYAYPLPKRRTVSSSRIRLESQQSRQPHENRRLCLIASNDAAVVPSRNQHRWGRQTGVEKSKRIGSGTPPRHHCYGDCCRASLALPGSAAPLANCNHLRCANSHLTPHGIRASRTPKAM